MKKEKYKYTKQKSFPPRRPVCVVGGEEQRCISCMKLVSLQILMYRMRARGTGKEQILRLRTGCLDAGA